MRTLLFARLPYSLSFFLLLAGSVEAGTHLIFGHAKNMSISELLAWTPPTLPTSLTWEIARATGPRLSWTVPITATGGNGSQLIFEVTEATAAAAGVDWSAWHSALNDRTFTRSFLTLGGVEVEPTLLRYRDYGAPFDLDQLKLSVFDHGTARVGFYPGVRAIASDYDAVPEPASWLLLVMGLLHFSGRRRKSTL